MSDEEFAILDDAALSEDDFDAVKTRAQDMTPTPTPTTSKRRRRRRGKKTAGATAPPTEETKTEETKPPEKKSKPRRRRRGKKPVEESEADMFDPEAIAREEKRKALREKLRRMRNGRGSKRAMEMREDDGIIKQELASMSPEEIKALVEQFGGMGKNISTSAIRKKMESGALMHQLGRMGQ